MPLPSVPGEKAPDRQLFAVIGSSFAMLYFGKTVLAAQGNPGILLPDSSHIGSLSEKTREESVADEGVLISLVAAFGHGVGKECYIHVFSVFVFALIRESHNTVQAVK